LVLISNPEPSSQVRLSRISLALIPLELGRGTDFVGGEGATTIRLWAGEELRNPQ